MTKYELNTNGLVLVVDDDESVRRSVTRILKDEGYSVHEASSGEQALEVLARNPIDVVLLDIVMPGMDGYATLRQIRLNDALSQLPVIFVTVLDDRESRIRGKEAGCSDFLVKPIDEIELRVRVKNLVLMRQYYLQIELESMSLKRRVADRTSLLSKAKVEIDRAQEALEHYHEEILFRMSKAVEFRDDETANHVQRMSRYCKVIALELGMTDEEAEVVRVTSALHDMGKIATPDGILRKPGKLDNEERGLMQLHAEIGHRLLSGSDSPLLETAATIAYTHHERFDGAGYPRKLKEEQIPLEGRIAAVADVFDALTSKRVYKPAFSMEKALGILNEERGRHFDAVIVDALVKRLDVVEQVMHNFADE